MSKVGKQILDAVAQGVNKVNSKAQQINNQVDPCPNCGYANSSNSPDGLPDPEIVDPNQDSSKDR